MSPKAWVTLSLLLVACAAGGGPGGGECIPETDLAFCQRLGKQCGEFVDFDNCGASRTVASCGRCDGAATCTASNQCGCVPEDDATLCGTDCGPKSVVDRCGTTRALDCAACPPYSKPCDRSSSLDVCDPGLTCLYLTLCTRECDRDEDCAGGGVCREIIEPGLFRCVLACSSSDDCESSFWCYDGGCVPLTP